jgi:hypothetical protein
MNAQSTLTKKSVVDQLTARLATRRMVRSRRAAAYNRLAQHVPGTRQQALGAQIVRAPVRECMQTAA